MLSDVENFFMPFCIAEYIKIPFLAYPHDLVSLFGTLALQPCTSVQLTYPGGMNGG